MPVPKEVLNKLSSGLRVDGSAAPWPLPTVLHWEKRTASSVAAGALERGGWGVLAAAPSQAGVFTPTVCLSGCRAVTGGLGHWMLTASLSSDFQTHHLTPSFLGVEKECGGRGVVYRHLLGLRSLTLGQSPGRSVDCPSGARLRGACGCIDLWCE